MPFDETLAARTRKVLARKGPFEEKRMFGGIAFMVDGKMCCGVLKDDLVARIAPSGSEAALGEPHVRPMDFTHRPVAGFLFVSAKGLARDADLARWVDRCHEYVRGLPAKPRKARKAKR